MRAILIAVMLCVGMAWAGESVDERVAAMLEQQVKDCQRAVTAGETNLRQLQVEGKKPNRGVVAQLDQARKMLAAKQAALAKLRPTLTPDQEIARAEAGVKAAEDALAKAKGELERAKAKGPKKN